MGLLDSFDIFEFLGFGEATGLELLFAASALVGGILFVVNTHKKTCANMFNF